MDANLIRQFARIYSPIYKPAFNCDQLYSEMHIGLVGKYGQHLFELGNGDFTFQCHESLIII